MERAIQPVASAVTEKDVSDQLAAVSTVDLAITLVGKDRVTVKAKPGSRMNPADQNKVFAKMEAAGMKPYRSLDKLTGSLYVEVHPKPVERAVISDG